MSKIFGPDGLALVRKVSTPASFTEVLPRGYELENVKENEFLAAKFRPGNSYDKKNNLYPVDCNHVALGRINSNGCAEFYGNITTNKSTILRGKPATLNIPFSHMDVHGNYTFKHLHNQDVFRILNRDPDRDEKLLYCQMMGYKTVTTQFLYRWSYILVPTSLDVYQKCSVEQHSVLKKLILENTENLETHLSKTSLEDKPRFFYNKGSRENPMERFNGEENKN